MVGLKEHCLGAALNMEDPDFYQQALKRCATNHAKRWGGIVTPIPSTNNSGGDGVAACMSTIVIGQIPNWDNLNYNGLPNKIYTYIHPLKENSVTQEFEMTTDDIVNENKELAAMPYDLHLQNCYLTQIEII